MNKEKDMESIVDLYKAIVEQHVADYYDNNDFEWTECVHTELDFTTYAFRSKSKEYLAVTGWTEDTEFNSPITFYIHPKIRGKVPLKNKLTLFGFKLLQRNMSF